ncbi:unnamed protein product [Caenorhabditis sp. 36 PRJEB53466]|nr:unnamed protein product [Caenorhabditis sp. 36 PRJEB53466]
MPWREGGAGRQGQPEKTNNTHAEDSLDDFPSTLTSSLSKCSRIAHPHVLLLLSRTSNLRPAPPRSPSALDLATGLQEVLEESVETTWTSLEVECSAETTETMTDSLSEATARRPRPQAASRRTVPPEVSFPVNKYSKCDRQPLPDCEQIPKVLCCTQRVLDKCMSGCIDYVTEKCPHKLEKYETIDEQQEPSTRAPKKTEVKAAKQVNNNNRVVGQVNHEVKEQFIDSKDIRRAPVTGDAKLLNKEYPITEVTDADLSSECGTERSQPPFSPCLSRKSADDVFLSCCRQQLPSNCHSLCTYEHREHVAAETLIQAIQQEHCDMKYLTNLLYCANQNRDNRACCSHLGMSNPDLGVGDRCLRMCNVAPSGDRVSSVEKEDLVCLSNWNVIMYCARGGLRTIN